MSYCTSIRGHQRWPQVRRSWSWSSRTRLSWIGDERFAEGAKAPATALMQHLGAFWEHEGSGECLGGGRREKKGRKGRGSEMRMMWIRLRWQPNVPPDHKHALWIAVMTVRLVLLSLVLVPLDSLEAPIPTGNRRELPGNANGNGDLAQVVPPWPKLQYGISASGRRWLIPTQRSRAGLNLLTVDEGTLRLYVQFSFVWPQNILLYTCLAISYSSCYFALFIFNTSNVTTLDLGTVRHSSHATICSWRWTV